jgi:hypothetical protein
LAKFPINSEPSFREPVLWMSPVSKKTSSRQLGE